MNLDYEFHKKDMHTAKIKSQNVEWINCYCFNSQFPW